VIGFDTRFASQRFAKAAAEVFAANGLEVLLCSSLPPHQPYLLLWCITKQAVV
jgi:phosphomannomutase